MPGNELSVNLIRNSRDPGGRFTSVFSESAQDFKAYLESIIDYLVQNVGPLVFNHFEYDEKHPEGGMCTVRGEGWIMEPLSSHSTMMRLTFTNNTDLIAFQLSGLMDSRKRTLAIVFL